MVFEYQIKDKMSKALALTDAMCSTLSAGTLPSGSEEYYEAAEKCCSQLLDVVKDVLYDFRGLSYSFPMTPGEVARALPMVSPTGVTNQYWIYAWETVQTFRHMEEDLAVLVDCLDNSISNTSEWKGAEVELFLLVRRILSEQSSSAIFKSMLQSRIKFNYVKEGTKEYVTPTIGDDQLEFISIGMAAAWFSGLCRKGEAVPGSFVLTSMQKSFS